MGLILVVLGLILWLAFGFFILGLILMIIGFLIWFAPGTPYGYSTWRHRGP